MELEQSSGGPSDLKANGVQVATLVLAVVGSVGAFVKFQTLDNQLGSLDIALKTREIRQLDEQLLTVTAAIKPGSQDGPYGSDRYRLARLVNLAIQLENAGQSDLDIERIDVQVFKQAGDERWQRFIDGNFQMFADPSGLAPPPLPPSALDEPPPEPGSVLYKAVDKAPAVAPPDSDPFAADNTDDERNSIPAPAPAAPPTMIDEMTPPIPQTGSRATDFAMEMIDAYSDDWQEAQPTWSYIPSEHNKRLAGRIRRGQKRALSLNYLVRDGESPELLKFQVVVHTRGASSLAPGITTWVGITGCGPFARFFPNETLQVAPAPGDAAPAPSAQLPTESTSL